MKILYSNYDIKKAFKSIANEHLTVYSVIDTLLSTLNSFINNKIDSKTIKLLDIINGTYSSLIFVNLDDVLIQINIDYMTKKIEVISEVLPCKIVYDDYPKMHFTPSGYEYQNKDRIVFHKYLTKLNPAYKNTYLFKIEEKENIYNIYINIEDANFNKNEFIKKILNANKAIHSVKDLMIIISEILDLSKCKIKLADKNDNVIDVENGNLINYVEYRNKEQEQQKIFLKNNDFYIERKTCEKDGEDVKTFIKKIGVNNGKEKR